MGCEKEASRPIRISTLHPQIHAIILLKSRKSRVVPKLLCAAVPQGRRIRPKADRNEGIGRVL